MDDPAPKPHAPRGRIKASLQPPDPMQRAPMNGAQVCTAHGKHSKKPCRNPAIAGGRVCRMHGGSAPQVKAKAMDRLMALQHPAIDRLTKLIEQEEFPTVAYAASRDVLDRTMGRAIEQHALAVSGDLTISWAISPVTRDQVDE